jgi:hypothetical protein
VELILRKWHEKKFATEKWREKRPTYSNLLDPECLAGEINQQQSKKIGSVKKTKKKTIATSSLKRHSIHLKHNPTTHLQEFLDSLFRIAFCQDRFYNIRAINGTQQGNQNHQCTAHHLPISRFFYMDAERESQARIGQPDFCIVLFNVLAIVLEPKHFLGFP